MEFLSNKGPNDVINTALQENRVTAQLAHYCCCSIAANKKPEPETKSPTKHERHNAPKKAKKKDRSQKRICSSRLEAPAE